MTQNEALIREFVAWQLADGRSPKTIKAYQEDLALASFAIDEVAPGAGFLGVSQRQLMVAFTSPRIQAKRNGQPRKANSVKRVSSAVSTFFSWAVAAEHRADNPAKAVKIRGAKRSLPVFLTLTEKKRLLRTLTTHTTVVSPRDRVMIEILLRTGIRLSELVNLNVDDVHLDDKHLRIRAKGGMDQIKFLKTSLRTLIKAYLKRHRPKDVDSPALFLSTWKRRISQRQVETRVKHWAKQAGIKKNISPHKLRHTFATHLLENTDNLRLVQRALGHQNIATTAIYAHVTDTKLADAIEDL